MKNNWLGLLIEYEIDRQKKMKKKGFGGKREKRKEDFKGRTKEWWSHDIFLCLIQQGSIDKIFPGFQLLVLSSTSPNNLTAFSMPNPRPIASKRKTRSEFSSQRIFWVHRTTSNRRVTPPGGCLRCKQRVSWYSALICFFHSWQHFSEDQMWWDASPLQSVHEKGIRVPGV